MRRTAAIVSLCIRAHLRHLTIPSAGFVDTAEIPPGHLMRSNETARPRLDEPNEAIEYEEITMSIKALSAACLLTILSASAMSAMAQDAVVSESYSYGTRLDVSQVISLTEDSGDNCGVVNAQMTYLDSQGEKRVLAYRKLSANCSEN